MGIGERIRNLRIERNITQTELASKIHATKQTVYKYEQGIVTNIPYDKIELLARALDTTPAYLMGWEDKNASFDIFSIPGIEPLPEMEKKPLLGTIACGEPILAEENIEDYIPVPKSNHCDFLLRCKGNSMIGARVHDGDLVCIRQQPTVENGEIAAVLIENEATLKRFYRYGDTVVLRAENLDFPDLEYKDSQLEGIRILGKATHFISRIK